LKKKIHWQEDSAKKRKKRKEKLSKKLEKEREVFNNKINGNDVNIRALDPWREFSEGLFLWTWKLPKKLVARTFIVEFKKPKSVQQVIKVIRNGVGKI